MFTGLVEEIGKVLKINKNQYSASITLQANKVLENIQIGDSISTNGVCLTVTQFNSESFTVDVMPETIRRSSLKNLKYGSKVNLERALKIGDRLGGHIVSGHIDGVGIIKNFEKDDNATWVTISVENKIIKYIIEKGSVAIDGISLTVAYVDEQIFQVSIIPLTNNETTLTSKKMGDEVNIECDIVGKYIERFINFSTDKTSKSNVDIDFLKTNGFI